MSSNNSTAAATRPDPTIPGIDGLRALAILLVIAWHCLLGTGFPRSGLGGWRPFAETGWAGVDLFFAISGFLITRLVLAEEATTGRIDLKSFYVRRALRIFPAFYLVLAVNLLLAQWTTLPTVAGAGARGALEVLALATYWSNYYYAWVAAWTPPGAVSIYWSLCVEEHFYLLWPLLLWSVHDRRWRAAVAVAACAALPLLRLAAPAWETLGAIHILSHYRIDSILWGCLAALVAPHLSVPAGRAALAVTTVATAVMVASGHLGGAITALGHSLGLSLLSLAAALLVAAVAATPGALAFGWLAAWPLRRIGRVSYGMYLLHLHAIPLVIPAVVAVEPVATPFSFTLLVAAATLATWGAAELMYAAWEQPFLAYKGRFTPPRAPAATGDGG